MSTAPGLAHAIPTVDAATIRRLAPKLPEHRIDPVRPLDMTDVTILAVLGNPDLKASRLKSGIAEAQVFAAGLLPDPQLSVNIDPVTNSIPGLQTGYSAGLSYDIQSLVIQGAKQEGARASAAKVNLENLWQEWQVIQQARTLYIALVVGERKLALLQDTLRLYQQRYEESTEALKRGNVSIETTGPDLVALLDVQSRVAQSERQLDRTRHGLLALLGLRPEVAIELAPLRAPSLVSDTTIDEALRTVTDRRPDLLALEAGYRAQEAQVRQAILAQFPSVSVGIIRASDTSNVHTLGFGITMNLPFLNANRGEIAVQRATREALRQEFQARLDKTVGEVDQLRQRRRLVMKQIDVLDGRLPELERMVTRAERGYRAHDIATLVYLDMENSRLRKHIERLDLVQMLWTTQVALDTLLGLTMEELPNVAGRQGS